MSDVTIRLATQDDAGTIVRMITELARQVGNTSERLVTEPQLIAAMADARSICTVLVAEDNSRVAGMVMYSVVFSTWRGTAGVYVMDLYIDEPWRGQGLGPELLRAAARASAVAGCGYMLLDVDIGNTGAQRFYDRMGFREISSDRRRVLEVEAFKDLIAENHDEVTAH